VDLGRDSDLLECLVEVVSEYVHSKKRRTGKKGNAREEAVSESDFEADLGLVDMVGCYVGEDGGSSVSAEVVVSAVYAELVSSELLVGTEEEEAVGDSQSSDSELESGELHEDKQNATYGDSKTCRMCERETFLTKHHLIPRTTHQRQRARGVERSVLNMCVMVRMTMYVR
jgi:hypothetical protein